MNNKHQNQNKQNNVIKFHNQIQINIGLIIIGIICIYLLFHIFSFLTAKQLTVYEVNSGTIVSNQTYQAIAIRSENIINADKSGEIYYYASNLDAVGVQSNVYSIDTSGTITDLLQNKKESLSTLSYNDERNIELQINSFLYDFSTNEYQRTYNFKNDLISNLKQYYSSNIMDQLAPEILSAQEQGDFSIYKAADAGIIVYQLDGYEGTLLEQVSSNLILNNKVEITPLSTQKNVKKGQPVYKLITSDHWQLATLISKELADTIMNDNLEYINIQFLADHVTSWAKCNIIEKSGEYILVLDLDDGVNRYADSRFLQIELLLNEKSGLKIPNTAIVEKEFFTIPKEYAFGGNDLSSPSFLLKDSDGQQLITPTIFYESDLYYYIDNEKIAKNDIIMKADSMSTYIVGTDTDKLSGVYCVNKGYALFKRIEPIYSNSDYTIIKNGTSYGIAMYDHIALQGSQMKENALIN